MLSVWALLASESHLGNGEVHWPTRCRRREVWSEARTLGCMWKQKQSSLPLTNVCQLQTVQPVHWVNKKRPGYNSSPVSIREVVRRKLASAVAQTEAFHWLLQCQRFVLSSPSVFVAKDLCTSDVEKSPQVVCGYCLKPWECFCFWGGVFFFFVEKNMEVKIACYFEENESKTFSEGKYELPDVPRILGETLQRNVSSFLMMW